MGQLTSLSSATSAVTPWSPSRRLSDDECDPDAFCCAAMISLMSDLQGEDCAAVRTIFMSFDSGSSLTETEVDAACESSCFATQHSMMMGVFDAPKGAPGCDTARGLAMVLELACPSGSAAQDYCIIDFQTTMRETATMDDGLDRPPTTAQLDMMCGNGECEAKSAGIIAQWIGDETADMLDVLCFQSDGEYCISQMSEFQAMMGDEGGAAPNFELMCTPCGRKLMEFAADRVMAEAAEATDGDTAIMGITGLLFNGMVRYGCMTDDEGGYCGAQLPDLMNQAFAGMGMELLVDSEAAEDGPLFSYLVGCSPLLHGEADSCSAACASGIDGLATLGCCSYGALSLSTGLRFLLENLFGPIFGGGSAASTPWRDAMGAGVVASCGLEDGELSDHGCCPAVAAFISIEEQSVWFGDSQCYDAIKAAIDASGSVQAMCDATLYNSDNLCGVAVSAAVTTYADAVAAGGGEGCNELGGLIGDTFDNLQCGSSRRRMEEAPDMSHPEEFFLNVESTVDDSFQILSEACGGSPPSFESCLGPSVTAQVCVDNLKYSYMSSSLNSHVSAEIRLAMREDLAEQLAIQVNQVEIYEITQGQGGITCFTVAISGLSDQESEALIQQLSELSAAGHITLVHVNEAVPDDAKDDPAESVSGQATMDVPDDGETAAASVSAVAGLASWMAVVAALQVLRANEGEAFE